MIPNEIAGKYELRGTLGSGAMGTVFDCLDRNIERRVAIKVVKLPPAGDPEGEEAHGRFRREAQAAGRLSHPNIVGVYDYGENAETAWIVMELVEGGSLKDRLDRKERFPVPEIVRIMDQVCAALAYSHGRGVVHRDIKPGNIMLGTDGTVKMADFGIARLENSSMTQVGTVMGTPSYMAPEQLRGETVDARADIWAAGVMLYQLLTGEKPFEGGFSAVMHKALHTEPSPPSQLSVTAPRAFDAVIAKALAKRPEDRYATAAAFAEAIRTAATAPAAEPVGFAGAGKLPGLDSDATMVGAPAPPPPPRPVAPPAPAAKGKAPVGLIAGGIGALAVAGLAAFLLLGGDGQPGEQQRLEQLRQTAEREATERQRAAGDERQRAAEAEQIRTTEPSTAQQDAARAEAEQRAQQEAARAAAAEQARLAAEQRSVEEAARAEAARRQPQTEATRLAAEQRARDEAARLEAARTEADRTRRQAEQARAEADQRARDQATAQQQAAAQAELERRTRDEEARRAEAARQQQAAEESRRRAEQLRADLAATGAALAAMPCSLVAWSATATTLTVSGVIRRADEPALRQQLAARALPPEALRLSLKTFDGPYCQALDLVRPLLAAPEAAPLAGILGTPPLAKGELLRMDVTTPPWPTQLYVSYLMQSGEVAHLVPSRPEAANAQIRLGDPAGGFTGWEVDEPFGTDLVLVFASDRPIFAQRRPVVEKSDEYLKALATAVRTAQGQGTRILVRALVVETVPRR